MSLFSKATTVFVISSVAVCSMYEKSFSADTKVISVPGTASGGFGHITSGDNFVPAVAFTRAGQKAVISASGTIMVGTTLDSGPSGIDRTRQNLGCSGFTPLEEGALEDADPTNDPDLSDCFAQIKNFGALIGAFIPYNTSTFIPRDEDLTGGALGVPSESLFLIGEGPYEFVSPSAGVLYLGENDSFTSNNSGAFSVTIQRPDILRYRYEGFVDNIVKDDAGIFTAAGIGLNTKFSGEFEYSFGDDPNFLFVGAARYFGGEMNVNFETGDFVRQLAGIGFFVNNDHASFDDGINSETTNITESTLSYTGVQILQVWLQDNSSSIYDSTDLPDSLILEDYNRRQLVLVGTILGGARDEFRGLLTSLNRIGEGEPPVADAGEDLSIRAGDLVALDGTGSFDDNTATGNLDYQWKIAQRPEGSFAVLDDPASDMPTFIADAVGTYIVELIVVDESELKSATDAVEISTNNLAPSANAGEDQLTFIGALVSLDGSGSSDPELDEISYEWTFETIPTGSLATLDAAKTEFPSFTPDVEGSYAIELIVSDIIGPGQPDSVEIIATGAEDYAEIQIVDAGAEISTIPTEDVTTAGNQSALTNFLKQAMTAILEDDIETAVDKLEKSIARTDGCILRGTPDANGNGRDWITDCEEQAIAYELLTDALAALSQ